MSSKITPKLLAYMVKEITEFNKAREVPRTAIKEKTKKIKKFQKKS